MEPGTISGRLSRIPPFTDPRARKLALRLRDELGRARRTAHERMGSAARSRPALHGMDVALERHLPGYGGFFVEAGANNGYLQSNTYYFERFKGWRGVLVEPIPELYSACVRERPASRVFNCALVPAGGEGPVTMHYGGLMSVVAGAQGSEEADRAHADAGSQLGWDAGYEITVPGRTLSSLLDEVRAPEVDLLSLDVEGFEAPALRGLDLDRHAPRFVLVEIRSPEARPPVDAVLADRYEAIEDLSPWDVLFRRRP